MVSTPEYYSACADLIRDIAEIFDHPSFLHIGYDEETFGHQKKMNFTVVRQGELWWHDFLWFIKTVEKNGMRAWPWSDYGWYHPDFVDSSPKSVLQSNGHEVIREGFDIFGIICRHENDKPDDKNHDAYVLVGRGAAGFGRDVWSGGAAIRLPQEVGDCA